MAPTRTRGYPSAGRNLVWPVILCRPSHSHSKVARPTPDISIDGDRNDGHAWVIRIDNAHDLDPAHSPRAKAKRGKNCTSPDRSTLSCETCSCCDDVEEYSSANDGFIDLVDRNSGC